MHRHTGAHTHAHRESQSQHIQFICKTWCRRSWFQKTKNLKTDIFISKFFLYLPHSNDVCVCEWVCVHASAQPLQSCPTLCNSMDCSPPGSSVKECSWQEYCSGLPCTPPGNLPNPGMEPMSPALQADWLSTEPPGKPIQMIIIININDSLKN